MSRSTYAPKEEYTGTGSLDTYTFDFKITAKSQLLIVEVNDSGVETQRVRGTDVTYLTSVTFDAVDGGGTVILAANLTNNYKLVLLLADDAPVQSYEFKNKTSFTLRRFEDALDETAGATQRLTYRGKQAFRIHDLDDEDTFNGQLPPGAATSGDKVLKVNAGGTGMEYGPSAGDISNAEGYANAASASAAAALVSENAAAADAVLTAADKIATNADVVLTNADVVLTNADAASTASDATDTGVDAAATAADKIATNADVVLTNADVVSTAADAVSTAADAAIAQASTEKYLSYANDAAYVTGIGRAAANSDVYYNTTSDVVRLYKAGAWVTVVDVETKTVATKTTTYTVAVTDDIVFVDSSGGAFTVTLFTAVGNSGKIITIKKTESSVNIVTIEGDGSETIDGNLNRKLATNNETIKLVSDGTNWEILDRSSSTPWTAFPSVAAGTLITGSTTDPTYGTTSTNSARWRREGENMLIEWDYAQTSGGTDGSGVYFFNLPSGYVIDSSIDVNTNITSATSSVMQQASIGSGYLHYANGASASRGDCTIIPYSTTQLKIYLSFVTEAAGADTDFWGVFYGFSLNPLSMSMRISVPITEWEG